LPAVAEKTYFFSVVVMVNSKNLNRLMAPTSIAFVGGAAMAESVRRCKEGGFKGDIWLVNPKAAEINGVPCFASVKDLPRAPDASFIATGREITVKIVKELAEIGAGGAVCYASGFAEMDAEGEELQRQLLANAGDVALIGPNCYGLLDYLHGAALWPAAYGGQLVDKGVAVLTQSGNFAYNLSMTDRSLPIAYLVSVGNQASVDVADLILNLLEEPRVTAIGVHLEGLKNVQAFAEAAKQALIKGVPIVALKSGVSAIGAELALSHTSSLAGSDELYNTLFDRLGVIRVDGPVAFVETLKVLSLGDLPRGSRVAALADSGGDAGMIADYSEANDVNLPQPTAQQALTLEKILPVFANVANPLDFTTAIWGNREALTKTITALLEEGYDYGLLVIDFPSEETGERPDCILIAEVFKDVLASLGIPGAVASIFPELMPQSAREMLHRAGVPALQGVQEGLQAIGNMMSYCQTRQQLLQSDAELSAPLLAAEPLRTEPKTLDEWDSKQALKLFGLPTPNSCLVAPADIPEAAKNLSYPVVAKIVSADLPHKTESGAVVLNIRSADQLQDAVSKMIEKQDKSLLIDKILIEEMCAEPVAELIVGVKREANFGLALVIGAGGMLVELLHDSCSLLLPTTPESVRAAVENLKVYKLMSGFRGRAAGDIDATVDAIMAIAKYAEEHARVISELDVNPLLVLESGVMAVDALVCIADQ